MSRAAVERILSDLTYTATRELGLKVDERLWDYLEKRVTGAFGIIGSAEDCPLLEGLLAESRARNEAGMKDYVKKVLQDYKRQMEITDKKETDTYLKETREWTEARKRRVATKEALAIYS